MKISDVRGSAVIFAVTGALKTFTRLHIKPRGLRLENDGSNVDAARDKWCGEHQRTMLHSAGQKDVQDDRSKSHSRETLGSSLKFDFLEALRREKRLQVDYSVTNRG
jgi:hypothetical protein